MNTCYSCGETDAVVALTAFLDALCLSSEEGRFVYRLAHSDSRWSTVDDLLSVSEREKLHEIAFHPKRGGFSSGNLKAHYVLDEDFINNGSAIVLFALVGSEWVHTVRVKDQNQFKSAEIWLEEEGR